MRQWLLMIGVVTLGSGCSLFGKIRDEINTLAEPISMQVVFIGLELPGPETGLDLTGTQYEQGGTISAFVYEADTEGVYPASGAEVALLSDRNGSVGLTEVKAGQYSATGAEGLEYSPLDEVEVVADIGGERHSIAMETPGAPDLGDQIPTELGTDRGFTVDLSGQGYDNAVVVVVDMTLQEIVWESEYDVESPVDPDNLFHVLEADLFEPEKLYAVGVVGLNSADKADFDGLQEISSGMMAGTMVLSPVSTFTFGS